MAANKLARNGAVSKILVLVTKYSDASGVQV